MRNAKKQACCVKVANIYLENHVYMVLSESRLKQSIDHSFPEAVKFIIEVARVAKEEGVVKSTPVFIILIKTSHFTYYEI
jgi:hypothetical protein